MTPSLELAKLFWAAAHQVQAGASVTLEWGGILNRSSALPPALHPHSTGIAEGESDPHPGKMLMSFHWARAPHPCHFTVTTSNIGIFKKPFG